MRLIQFWFIDFLYFPAINHTFLSQFSVIRYDSSRKAEWDQLVNLAKNATFLFQRDFMEYHADRFTDFSLMVYKNQKPVAVLPANRIKETLYSHNGLTYGGLVLSAKAKMREVLPIFRQIMVFLTENRVKNLIIKPIPSFYTELPAEELEYFLFIASAETVRVEVASVIDYRNRLPIQKNRLEGLKKADKNRLKIIETDDFSAFWNEILIPNLTTKHGAHPVHALEEIKYLAQKFPKNIRQFNVIDPTGKTVAGATLFESKNVAHVQYISGNEEKQQLGSLDFLFHHLIDQVFARKRYFDFGTSNENKGKNLNSGLHYWKESFGARTMVYKTYRVKTENHFMLDNVLL